MGMKINVMTDHHSLTYLLKQRSLSRRQAWWLEQLANFDIDFKYIKGEDNSVADALSCKDCEDIAPLTTSSMPLSETFKTQVCQGYENDKFCQDV